MIINTEFYFGENMVKYKHFESINSTSTYIKDNYQTLDNMFFVSSSFQSEGHGRKGRKWLSKSGEDLLFSVLIKDKEIIEDYAYISLFSALEIVRCLKELILQPQSEIQLFRKFLRENYFRIVEEDMIFEDGKYYPLMRVVPVSQGAKLEEPDELKDLYQKAK